MEVLSIIWEVLKCTAVPVSKRINYIRNLPENMKVLKEQADSLHAKRDDFLNKIERLKFEKAPTEHGKKWLQDVEQIEQQLREMEKECQDVATKGCGIRWCCNMYSRRKLGESVEDMKSKIQGLDVNNFDNNFLNDLPIPRVPMVPNLSMKAETVADATLKELLNFLQDKKIRKIGIWGKGGIGKTTIMKALNNKPEVRAMFDLIIWVTVSNTWDIKKLQKEIADRLSLDVQDKSEDNVAVTLLEKLGDQKYLLLLDDVWEMVDLVKIGVPNACGDNDCKVVLTTREMKVCREMETDKEIKLIPWPKKEAWDMFSSKVGDVAITPEIRELAEGIVEECAGLPLALNVVAGMLRKEEDVHVWKDILTGLRYPCTSNNIGMNERVYEILKLSYDYIKDKKTRTCFLFCGLYQEDKMIKKSEVIRNWHGEGLLLTNGTLVDSYNRGHLVIRDLVDKSLLERCDDERFVKLHDLVRDMVLTIISLSHGEQSRHLVINYSSPNPGEPSIEKWESAKRISIMRAKLEDLPRNSNCSTLSTLIICESYRLEEILEEFFMHMSELVVLNLSSTYIAHLPTSVVNLINLRSLLLRHCSHLKTLPKEVSAMKKLEVLWATGTRLEYVPLEVFELTSLKCLKLTSRNYYNTWTTPLISGGGVKWRLKLLEVFVISDNLFGSIRDEDIRVIAKELGMLRGLRSLLFYFRTLENFKEFMQGRSSIPWRSLRDQILTKFRISINCDDLHFVYVRQWKKCLAYDGAAAAAAGDDGGGEEEEGSNDNNMYMLPDCISEVLACCDRFVLQNHGGVKFLSTLFSSFGNSGRGLRSCLVSRCMAMEKIIENGNDDDIFPNLEVLYLFWLENLRSIWDPTKPQRNSITSSSNNITSSFSSLRELRVFTCGRLKKMFSWRFLCTLSNLTDLRISDCRELRVMISEEDKDEEKEEITAAAAAVGQVKEAAAPLPKLKILELRDLPQFESLCSITNTKEASSSLRWPSLEELCMYDCPKLRRFPFNYAAPNLKRIHLGNLTEFESLCTSSTNTKEASFSSSSLRWPSLKELSISDCPKLRRLPFNNIDDNAPKLKMIRGQQCWWEALEWDDDEHDDHAAFAAKLRLQPLFIPFEH